MFIKLYYAVIAVVNLWFVVLLFHKAWTDRRELLSGPGNPVLLAIYSALLQFLAAFGISDFSVSIVVYRKFHLVDDRKLPGTLLTACVIPVTVMAVGYLATIRIEETTLMVCVICGLAGALAGSSFITRLKPSAIKLLLVLALLAAGVLGLFRMLGIVPSGGTAHGFEGWKLWLTGAVTFALSGLSMGGFAVTALLLSFFYAMGLDPMAAFPLAMGTCTISCATGGIRYIKSGQFSLKIALFSTIFGAIGAFIAVRFVHSLNVTVLQGAILGVVVYSAISMLMELFQERRVRRTGRQKVPDPAGGSRTGEVIGKNHGMSK